MSIIIDGTGSISGVSSTGLSSAQNVPYANLPTGSVLQVVSATYGATVASTSSTFATSGLSATITPKFSTSKILAIYAGSVYSPSTNGNGATTLLRGATNLGNTTYGLAEYLAANNFVMPTSFTYYDSPATTSATTYAVQFKAISGTIYIQVDTVPSTLTLMEIAG